MKKLLFILIISVLILCSCESKFVEFPYDLDFDDGTGLEPLIKGFDGELFGDRNITVDGLYTGFEKLDFSTNMMYCNDDNSIIWWERENNSLYRLNINDQKEKICDDFMMFNCLYTNGWLYYTYGGYDTVDVEVNYFYDEYKTKQKVVSEGAFIFRYNIDTHEREKLMEFQGASQCELALNGRYLYAQTYNWEYADFAVTRMDLYQENAVVVYSDLMKRDDFGIIGPLSEFRFNKDIIFTAGSNSNTKKKLCKYMHGRSEIYRDAV